MLHRSVLYRNNGRQKAFEKTLGLIRFSKVTEDLSSVPIKPRWKQRGNSCHLCSDLHTRSVAAHTHARAHTCTHNAELLKGATVLWILCSDIFPLKNKDETKTFLLRQKHAASHHRLSMVKHPTTLDSSTQEAKAGGLSSK